MLSSFVLVKLTTFDVEHVHNSSLSLLYSPVEEGGRILTFLVILTRIW